MIAWGIETIVATTVLMLIVLALRGPVRRSFGPAVAYALWALPVLRFLLPPLPESVREQAVTPIAAASQAVTLYVIEPLSTPPAHAAMAGAPAPAAPIIDWVGTLFPALFALWAVGAAVFLAYHLITHSRYCADLRRRARVAHTVAGGRVHVIETDATSGPLAFGIWRKYVAFPRDFHERYDAQERDLALAHELGHHIRGDLIANWVALVVLAIHWFNPVAWRAFRAFRADQEMACDALVLAGRAPALRHAYGRAIVKSAHGGAVSAACHLHTINDIKGRLRMLTVTRRISRARFAAGLAGVSALAVAGLGLTASGTQAAERLRVHMEDSIGVDLAALDVLPPVPPVPAVQGVPAAPPAPPVPGAAPVPPVPPAPPADGATVTTTEDGKTVRTIIIHRDGKDGKGKRDHEVHRYVFSGSGDAIPPDLEARLAEIPEVRSEKCGTGGDGAMVRHSKDGKKQITVICTDRIAAQTASAVAVAERSRDLGLMRARVGLDHARAAIEGNSALSEKQRAEALAGIDQARREIEAEKDED
jgi:beta-lactamase regulating signal transducer with metallopeptidase domain